MNHPSLSNNFPPSMMLSTILTPFPGGGVDSFTTSEVSLILDNFTVIPYGVEVAGDIDSLNYATDGLVSIQSDGDIFFLSDTLTNTALASGNFSTEIRGQGEDYLGQVAIASELMGHFWVPANTPLTFDLDAWVSLTNHTHHLAATPVSSGVDLQLTLYNLSTQQSYNLLNISGLINTNSPENSEDSVNFSASQNFDSVTSGSQFLSSVNRETFTYFFEASYTMMLDQDAELILVGTLSSFNYNATFNSSYVKEPSPVTGTPGADKLQAGRDFQGQGNKLFTGAGDDEVDTLPGAALAQQSRIFTGSGADTLLVNNGDRANGGSGNDDFDATNASDYRLSGGNGDDRFLLGTAGRAIGGEGNDQFYVGEGGDNLIVGGAGADQFWLLSDAPQLITIPNRVTDFAQGVDVIGILNQGSDVGFANLSFNGENIALDGHVFATLVGFDTTTLTAADFLFS